MDNIFLVSEFDGNWKILENGIYDKQDFFYPFWAILTKPIKVVCLRWHLTPTLIGVSWIWWWCSLFLSWTKNTLLLQIWPKKIKKTVCLRWHLVPRLIQICWSVYFFCFGPKTPFLDKFGSENQSCLLKMNFGDQHNLNKLKLMLMFICPVLDPNNILFEQLGSKKWHCLFKMKFGT